MWSLLAVYATLRWCLSLLGFDCVLSLLFTTLENEEEEFAEEGYYNTCLFQDQGQTSTKASHPNACCYYTYHYQSCMFLPLKFYQNLIIKTIFDVAITTIIL